MIFQRRPSKFVHSSWGNRDKGRADSSLELFATQGTSAALCDNNRVWLSDVADRGKLGGRSNFWCCKLADENDKCIQPPIVDSWSARKMEMKLSSGAVV